MILFLWHGKKRKNWFINHKEQTEVHIYEFMYSKLDETNYVCHQKVRNEVNKDAPATFQNILFYKEVTIFSSFKSKVFIYLFFP